ncbi:MAG: hypothetical protein JXQ68_05000 [Campylobacterales bacterium]|nr:hypothetical protein [Campylobacterales bacterium]
MTIFEKKALILQNFVEHYCGDNWDAAIVHLCLNNEDELSDLMGGDMDVPDLVIRHINLLQREEEFRSKKQTLLSYLPLNTYLQIYLSFLPYRDLFFLVQC